MKTKKAFEKFAQNLQILRFERGYSQSELARKMHMPQPTISAYERLARFPDKRNLKKFADFFGVSVDELIGAKKTVVKDTTQLDLVEHSLQKVFDDCYSLIQDLEKLARRIDNIKKNA